MNIFLAEPRGFCAGVIRAIDTLEELLHKFGAPIYVKHEIVHNKYVVEDLRKKGAIFVEELDEIPEGARAVFSAHGVSDKVVADAKKRNLLVTDATCPLVSKVHRKAKEYEKNDYEIILIGHKGHPEVIGTSGRVQKPVILISNKIEAQKLEIADSSKIAYVTQTTLSVDDTKEIVEILENKFPQMQRGLATKDICYATQNRQDAVKELVKIVDLLLIIGAKNSSNSNRLRDLGEESNLPSYLINDANDIKNKWLEGVDNIGISAGASAPEILVQEVIEKLKILSPTKIIIKTLEGKKENVHLVLPKEVRN